MMRPPVDPKTPEEVKNYGIEWRKYLLPGASITSSLWSDSSPAGLTKVASAIDGTVAVVRLSGGVAGQRYTLINTITTSTGEEVLPRALEIPVKTAEAIAGISGP